ncbi:hypothetical protein AVEN_108076-1 [Araneus ventricosus]|uniref:Transposase Tc1-like domain-containing protein n=1 Tax=Araneus ventricosus TaxID=182803 RepID=A0A4Y2KA31_ARAVE|nr:hypothetical protein AVEN_108076-1 [Araneus ventricosus]
MIPQTGRTEEARRKSTLRDFSTEKIANRVYPIQLIFPWKSCKVYETVFVQKWINDGDTSSRRQGVGPSRVIKEKGRRRLSRLVKQNRRQTVTQPTAQYNAGPSASVSEHIVQRTLFDMGLCSRRPIRVPLFIKRHRQLRLQWAREHRDWTMDEWKRVA